MELNWRNANLEEPDIDTEYLVFVRTDKTSGYVDILPYVDGDWLDYDRIEHRMVAVDGVEWFTEVPLPPNAFEDDTPDLEAALKALSEATRWIGLVHRAQERDSGFMAEGFAQKAVDRLQSAIAELNKCNS